MGTKGQAENIVSYGDCSESAKSNQTDWRAVDEYIKTPIASDSEDEKNTESSKSCGEKDQRGRKAIQGTKGDIAPLLKTSQHRDNAHASYLEVRTLLPLQQKGVLEERMHKESGGK